ncbi:MAG: CocE/NonD family hydrolase [Anaerolineae bacterium]
MTSVIVEQDVCMQTRDGVTLKADVYRPCEAGRFPVLLCRTPYNKAGVVTVPYHSPLGFAQTGYVVVAQDCRGTGSSGGLFDYFNQLAQEGLDGYDTVEWAASLPYCDGNVGMFGGSYVGWTQWAAAMQRPPHLRAIVPIVTWSDSCEGVIYRGGALELGLLLSWHLGMALGVKTRQLQAAGASPEEIAGMTTRLAVEMDRLCSDGYYQVPLPDLPNLRTLGLNDVLSYIVTKGPGQLPTNWSVNPSDVDVPSLNIGGWADILLRGTLQTYLGTHQHGRGLAQKSQVIIGPWNHGGFGSTIGEKDLGAGANSAWIDLKESLFAMHLRWYDRWLKGVDNGVEKQEPVRIFVSGENRWLSLPDWPPPDTHQQAHYLQAGGLVKLSPPDGAAGSSHFRYDPEKPAPTLGGNTLMPGVFPPGIKNQRPLSLRQDVLTFFGSPLAQPLTIIGDVIAKLWVSSSAPDTDFIVRLLDIHPDGYMQNICDGILRTRYRDSLTESTWLEPGKAYELTIDLWATAHTYLTGHRVGVQVTSSSFPRWDRNWNSSVDPALATMGVVADQTIWHEAAHPSCIILPVVD